MIKWLARRWLDAVDRAQQERDVEKKLLELSKEPDAVCDNCYGDGTVACWHNNRYYGESQCNACGGVGIKPERILD